MDGRPARVVTEGMGAIEPALRVFRTEHAHVFAALWRRLGEFDLVEAAMADAYLAAMAAWGSAGVPQNPTSWMATVAMSATTSVLSRRGGEPTEPGSPTDELRALFATCCQPALGPGERTVAVARAVVGLMPSEIAALLGVPDPQVNQALTQIKKVLRQPGHGLAALPTDAAPRAERVQAAEAAVAALAAAPGSDAAEVAAIARARLDAALAG